MAFATISFEFDGNVYRAEGEVCGPGRLRLTIRDESNEILHVSILDRGATMTDKITAWKKEQGYKNLARDIALAAVPDAKTLREI